MERKNTGWKVLTLILFIALLGTSGFITYDKVLKDKYFTKKDDKKEEKKETNTTTTTDNDKTADDLYAEYLENLKENMSQTYNSADNIDVEEAIELKDKVYNYGRNNKCSGFTNTVCAMTDNNKIKVTISSDIQVEKDYGVIDNDVVYTEVQAAGQGGGIVDIYYIKDNGKVYVASVSEDGSNESIETEEITGLNNIIYIIPSTFGIMTGWEAPIFVDIEGNLFRVDNGTVIQLNQE